MGSNKQKKLLSKVLLSGVILTMVGTDIVPAFSYAKDVHGFDAEVVSESDNSPESTEEPMLESSKEELESVNDEIVEDAQEEVGDEVNEQLDDNSGGDVIEEGNPETIDDEDKETELEGVKEEAKVSTMTMRATVQEENTYVMATDADFIGTTNGSFRYIGDDEYVEIPHKIKGVNVTSYYRMFNEKDVKGVKSTNKNIVSTQEMFHDFKGRSIDISQLDTTNVREMGYMFSATSVGQNGIRSIIGLESMDTSRVYGMSRMFYRSMVTSVDLSNFDTSNVVTMSAMFADSLLTTIDVTGFDTTKVTDMAMMFYNTLPTTLDLSNFNTSNVTSTSAMFERARVTDLRGLAGMDTAKVTHFTSMFKDTVVKNLDLSNFDTTRATNMSAMFQGSSVNEIDLTKFNTTNVTTMSNMFKDSKATEINLSTLNTAKVKNMNSMFDGADATGLDLGSFDTSNVTDMIYMFRDTSATTLNLSSFKTSKVTKMTQMFKNSQALQLDLRGFNTQNVTDMSEMFQGSSVVDLDLTSFNTSRITNMGSFFKDAKAKTIKIGSFDTTYVTDMKNMFQNTKVSSLDLSSFDLGSVNNTDNMFQGSTVTRVNARASLDKEKLSKSINKPASMVIDTLYKVAKDEDFSGFYNGIFRYIGKDEYVEIPHKIKGTNVTSYKSLFENTHVKGVISTNKNVTDMSNMFKGNTATYLDVGTIVTSNVTDMSGMFQDTKTTKLDLTNFLTTKVTNMGSMFRNTKVNELDLGSFDLTKVISLDNMFQNTTATIGYGRGNTEITKLNDSLNKPIGLNFAVWGIITEQSTYDWSNKPVEVGIKAVSDKVGVSYVEMVNETGRNYLIKSNSAGWFNTNNGVTSPLIKGYDTEIGAHWMSGTIKTTGEWFLSLYTGMAWDSGRGSTYSEDLFPIQDDVTFSLSVMSEEPIRIGFRNGKQVTLKPNQWERISVVGSTYEGRPAGIDSPIQPNITPGTKLYYKDYKIEKGGEATLQWKPAPEDSESSSGKQDAFNVYSNGTYIFRATDTAGNTKTVSHTVSNIDTTQPTAELKSSPEGWTSTDVKIYVNAKDDLSGISHITLPNGEKVYKDTVEYPVSSNGTYTFTVTDKAGNTTTYKEEVKNIDKSIPKLESTVDNTKWTTETVGIDVLSGDSASGIKDIQLVSSPLEGRNLLVNTGELKQVTFSGWQNYFPDVQLSTVGLDELRKGGNFRFQGHVDNLKGEDDVGLMLHLATSDTTYLQYATSNTNQVPIKANSSGKVYMELNLDANKDIKTGYVALRHISINAKSSTATMSKVKLEYGGINTPWTPAPEDIQLKGNSKHYPVASNGLYTFKATYNNGSTSETSVNVTNIDRTAPGVTIKGNVEDWTEEDKLTLSINATDTQSGVKSITLPDGKVVSAKTATFDVTKNGEYEFIVMDNVGNTTKHTETVEYMMIPYSFYMYDKNGVPVKGVEFELMRNGEYYKTAISDVNGLVTFGKVPPDGKYQVRQVTAPGGVVLDPKDIENGDFTEPVEVVTYPRGLELPGTGTSYVLVVSGVIGLTLLGIAKVRSKRKKLRGKDVQR